MAKSENRYLLYFCRYRNTVPEAKLNLSILDLWMKSEEFDVYTVHCTMYMIVFITHKR